MAVSSRCTELKDHSSNTVLCFITLLPEVGAIAFSQLACSCL